MNTLPNLNSVLIAAVGVLGAVLSALILRGQNKIHVLVNSNLDALKQQLVDVADELETVRDERDRAQAVTESVVAAADATADVLRIVEENRPG